MAEKKQMDSDVGLPKAIAIRCPDEKRACLYVRLDVVEAVRARKGETADKMIDALDDAIEAADGGKYSGMDSQWVMDAIAREWD